MSKEKKKKNWIRDSFFIIGSWLLIILLLWGIYIYVIQKPSNTRHWEVGFEKTATVALQHDSVTIHNFRDFHFAPDDTITSFNYHTDTQDLSKLQRVWFLYEPFTVPPFDTFKGVAHTYFVFDFLGEKPVAVSVEARREVGERYSVFKGVINSFELSYIWASENDMTGQRGYTPKNNLYMFPLLLTPADTKRLFLQISQTTNDLAIHPRFYNTLTSNCTNELAKAANHVQKGTIPFDKALIFPGFSDELLYRLKLIPHDMPLATIRNKYYISDFIKKVTHDEHFSDNLRAYLSTK